MCVLLKGGVGVSTPTFFISGTGSGTPDRVPPVRPSLAGREPACQRWSSGLLPECNVGKSCMFRTGRRQPSRGLDTAAPLPPPSALTRRDRPAPGQRHRAPDRARWSKSGKWPGAAGRRRSCRRRDRPAPGLRQAKRAAPEARRRQGSSPKGRDRVAGSMRSTPSPAP